jgi:hypothetical protein
MYIYIYIHTYHNIINYIILYLYDEEDSPDKETRNMPLTGRKRGRPPTKQSLDVDPVQDTSKKGNPSNMLYKKLDVRLLSELLYYL